MKKLKILLADPRHDTVGAHSNYIPIGIGYIASYLKHNLKEKVDLEIALSTKPQEIFELINIFKPDVIACSNYMWNSSLSNTICSYAKKINEIFKINKTIEQNKLALLLILSIFGKGSNCLTLILKFKGTTTLLSPRVTPPPIFPKEAPPDI